MGEALSVREVAQQNSSAKFLPAFFVEPVQPREMLDEESLPSHLELFGAINLDITSADPRFTNRFQVFRHFARPIRSLRTSVVSTQETKIGFESTMRATNEIIIAHRALLAAVRIAPSIRDSQRIALQPKLIYSNEDRPLPVGSEVTFSQLSVLASHHAMNGWVVAETVPFSGGDE